MHYCFLKAVSLSRGPVYSPYSRGCPVHPPRLKTMSALASISWGNMYQPLSTLVPYSSIYALIIRCEGCWLVVAVLGSLRALLGLAEHQS